jgi:hypothetical protein
MIPLELAKLTALMEHTSYRWRAKLNLLAMQAAVAEVRACCTQGYCHSSRVMSL